MSWSAAQYVKFEDERTRPVRDLIARIPNAEVVSAADIGCGPGNSTEVLRERCPSAHIVGIVSSPDMIEAARKRLPDIAFEVADIREWRAERPFDVILANAVLQWIPGHETLAPALIGRLAPGGALAVQTPDNLDEPSHRLMRETAAQGPWAAKLAGAGKARAERHGAEWYFRLLRAHAPHVDVWRTTYITPSPAGRPQSSNGSRRRACARSLTRSRRPSARPFFRATRRPSPRLIRPRRTGPCCCPFRGYSSSRRVEPWAGRALSDRTDMGLVITAPRGTNPGAAASLRSRRWFVPRPGPGEGGVQFRPHAFRFKALAVFFCRSSLVAPTPQAARNFVAKAAPSATR